MSDGQRKVDEWRKTFGGGMIPFDNAYWAAKKQNRTTAEAQAAGVEALLREFVDWDPDADRGPEGVRFHVFRRKAGS